MKEIKKVNKKKADFMNICPIPIFSSSGIIGSKAN